jgi:transcriptional regulator with XRE-family HTH domain
MDPLRRYRQQAKISREAAAARTGCSASMLQQLENGSRPSRSAVLRRYVGVLAAELDLNYGLLLTEVEGPRNGETPAVAAEASQQTPEMGGTSDDQA